MANTGFKGVDVRQTGNQIVVRVSLKDSAGAKVTTGTGSLYLYELQSDGTLKSYDFNDNTFKTTALTTETASLTHRSGNNGTTTTGVWTSALSTLSGFTAGSVYIAVVSHTSASPPQQEREFQYGSEQGDYVVGSIPAVAAGANGGLPLGDASGRVDLGKWLGSAPNALQTGRVDSYLGAVASGVIAAASFASGALDAVWSVATRVLTAGTNIVLAKGTGLTGLNDLSAAQVNAEADTALADVGLTSTITGRIDAAVSSRSSHSAADVATQVTTDHGSGSYVRNTEPPTAAAVASQVRTELATELARLDANISSRSTYDGSDTTGTTTLLARLSSARALLLDNLTNLDAAISSRLAAAAYTAPDNATIASIDAAVTSGISLLLSASAAIKAQTDLLPASPASAGDAMTLTSGERQAIADAYLDRANGVESGLTPRQAQRLAMAALIGKASGMDAFAPVFRDTNDTKDRIQAVCDDQGNRLSVTVDAS